MTEKGIKSPFNLYDVFGYIIPAIMFIIGILVYFGIMKDFNGLVSAISIMGKGSTSIYIICGILVVGILYVLGHIIATMSSICLDKILVEGCMGYPFEWLLGIPKATRPLRKLKRYAFQTSFFALTVFWMVGLFHPNIFYIPYAKWLLLSICGLLFLVSLLTYVKVLSIEKRQKGQRLTYCQNLIFRKRRLFSKSILRLMFTIVFVPHFCFWLMIEVPLLVIRAKRGFELKFQESLRKKYYEDFGIPVEDAETNAFWLPYIYVVRNSPADGNILRQFLNLYGFARNLSMAFILLSAFGFIIRFYNYNSMSIFRLVCLYSLLAIIFGLRYYYLYYGYYSKYLYRAYALLKVTSPPSDERSGDSGKSVIE